jgi:flagellar basal-body rod modification protein FlgD
MAVAGVTAAAAAAADPSGAASAVNNQLNKDTFLKLLVAQIRNQNPLNPSDGVQFVSQLAQFSELEQMMSIRSEVEQFHTDLKPAPAAPRPEGEVAHTRN